MATAANTPEEHVATLPIVRLQAMAALREAIHKNLPKGFSARKFHEVLAYVVPHSLHSAGYRCNTNDPVPSISFSAQEKFPSIALTK